MISQLSLPFSPSPSLFLVGSSNREIVSLIHRWPHWPVRLVGLYGEPGCGKSHLASLFAKKSGARLLSRKALESPPHVVAASHFLFIVDEDAVIQNEPWLFHFYNAIQEENKTVLFCSRFPPTHTLFALPDLASRMRSIFPVRIQPPEELFLRVLFQERLKKLGFILGEDYTALSNYVFYRIERSYQAIHRLITIIDQSSLQEQKPLSLSFIRDLFHHVDFERSIESFP